MKRQIILIAFISILLASCFHSGDDASLTTGTGLALTAADKSTVSPCPDQSILTDATELAALQDALLTGTLSFLDVPYNGTDADNFKKKCGFESYWDPANNTNEVPEGNVGGPPVTLSSLLNIGNAGICTANSSPMNFITGFPAAGTYRGEIKAAKGGFTWHLRYRAIASGSSAGNTFTAEGLSIPSDEQNVIEYKVNGTVTSHANLFSAIVNAMSTTGSSVALDISKTSGGATVFSLSIDVICVTKS